MPSSQFVESTLRFFHRAKSQGWAYNANGSRNDILLEDGEAYQGPGEVIIQRSRAFVRLPDRREVVLQPGTPVRYALPVGQSGTEGTRAWQWNIL